MGFYDAAAQNFALDAIWAAVPSFEFGLLSTDPTFTAPVEAAYPGYARVAGSPASWLPSAGGVKQSVLVTFPDSTGAGGTYPCWAAYKDGALFDFGPLSEPISVTAAGAGPAIRVRRRFNDRLV